MDAATKLIDELKLCVNEFFDEINPVYTSFYKYVEKHKETPDVIKTHCLRIFDGCTLTPTLLENKRIKMGTVDFSYIYTALDDKERQRSLMIAYFAVIEKDRKTEAAKKEFGIIIEPLHPSSTKTNKSVPVVESLSSSSSSSSSSSEESSDEEEISPELQGLLKHIFNNLQQVQQSREEYYNNLAVPEGVHIKK